MGAAVEFVLQQEIMIWEISLWKHSVKLLTHLITAMKTFEKLTDLTDIVRECGNCSEIF